MTVYFLHDCQDADGTAIADAAPVIDDSGNGWTLRNGGLDITGNMIRAPDVTSPGGIATFDCGDTDGIFRLVIRTGSTISSVGLILRYVDNDNFLYVSFDADGSGRYVKMHVKYEGSYAELVPNTGMAASDGHWRTLEVHLVGNTYTVYANGIHIADVTDAHFPTSTIHGLRFGATDHRVRQLEYRDTSTLRMPGVTEMDHIRMTPKIRDGFYTQWFEDFFRGTASSEFVDHSPMPVVNLDPGHAARPVWTQRSGTFVFLASGKGIEASAAELTVATQSCPSPDGVWQVTVMENGDTKNVGLALRYDPSDGSFVMIRSKSIHDTINVYSYDGSSFTKLGSLSHASSPGSHDLWVRSWGDDLLVGYDDTVVGKVTTSFNNTLTHHGVIISGIDFPEKSHAITHYAYLHPNSKPLRKPGVLAAATEAHVRLFDFTGRTYEHAVSVSGSLVAIGTTKHDDDATDLILSVEGETTSTSNTANSAVLANRDNSYFADGQNWTGLSGSTIITAISTAPIRGVEITEGAAACPMGTGAWCQPRECMYGGDVYTARVSAYQGQIWYFKNGVPQGYIGPTWSLNEYLHIGVACVATTNGVLLLSSGHNSANLYACYLAGGDYANASTVRTIGSAYSRLSYMVVAVKSDGSVIILSRGTDDYTGPGGAKDAVLYTLANPEALDSEAASYTVDYICDNSLGWMYPASVVAHDNDVYTFVWSVRDTQQRYLAAAIYAPEIGDHGRWYLLDGTAADVNDALGTAAVPRFTTASDLTVYDGSATRNTFAGRFHVGEITQAPAAGTAGTAQLLIPYFQLENTDWDVYGNTIFNWLSVADDLSVTHIVDSKSNAAEDVTGNGHDGTMTGLSGQDYWSPDVPTAMEPGWSMVFDGTDSFVQVADADALSFGSGTADSPFSVSAWIKMVDATNFYIIHKYVDTFVREWAFRVNGDDKLNVILFDNSSGTYIGRTYDTAITAQEGSWIHVAMTYDGSGAASGIALYLNGSAVDDVDYTSGSYTAMENSTSPLQIGGQSPGAVFDDGKITDVRLYSEELTSADITTLYGGGNPDATLVGHWIAKSSLWSGSNNSRIDCVGKSNRFVLHERGVTREPHNRWNEDINPYYDWNGAASLGVYDVATPFATPAFALAQTIDVHPLAGQIGIVDGSGTQLSIQTYETPRICETHTPSRILIKNIMP